MTSRRAGVVVFLVALLVRVVLLLDARDAPFWRAPVADERAYIELARGLLLGQPPAHGAWYVSPGYAYVLAGVFRLGGGFLAAKLLNLLAGVLGTVLVWRLGSRIAGVRVALVAGLVWAIYPAALLQELLLLKTTLAVTCALGALVAIPFGAGSSRGTTAQEDRANGSTAPSWRWLLAGILCGAALLLRGEWAIIPLVLVVAGLVARHRHWPEAPSLGGLVLFLAAAASAVAVPTVQNRDWSGQWVAVAFGGGPNFYIGNHAGADGGYVPLREDRSDPGQEEADAVLLASRAVGHPATPREVSRYWYARGLEWWRRQPVRALALTAKKLALVWGPHELSDTFSTSLAGRWVLLLRDRLVGPALVLPAALIGLWITRRRRALWPLHAFLIAAQIAIVPFFLFERFRLHMVAVCVPFAVLAGAGGLAAWRARRWRTLAVGLACTAGLGAVLGMARVPRDEVVLRANIGDMLFDAGRPQEALAEYRAVLAAAPDAWRIDIKVANALIALGRPEEALAALGRVLDHLHAEAQRTGLPSAEEMVYCHELAGDLEAASGRFDAAAAHYEAALAVAPVDAETRLRAKLAACRRSER
jgi:tetratricopeptide (TPR) repeat protein